jgi:hypothetical protein
MNAVGIVWLALTTLCLISRLSGILKSFTLHGKLREDKVQLPRSSIWQVLLVEATVSKRIFWHFYIVAVAVAAALCEYGEVGFLFLLHSLRRLLEQFFLFTGNRNTRMHLCAYLLGLCFYPLVGVSIWLDSMSGCDLRVTSTLVSAFVVFQVFQSLAHVELAKLQRTGNYGVPRGMLFSYIWCPHYAAEIGIYLCLALSGGITTKMCALFVVVSMAVNAENQVNWYKTKFGENKNGLLPGLW